MGCLESAGTRNCAKKIHRIEKSYSLIARPLSMRAHGSGLFVLHIVAKVRDYRATKKRAGERPMAIRPDFLGLEAFVAVAERGSFNRAAAHLGITQTALSHRMRKLEAYLGSALLLRTTRSVSLCQRQAVPLAGPRRCCEELVRPR
jgi:hypothetical protein